MSNGRFYQHRPGQDSRFPGEGLPCQLSPGRKESGRLPFARTCPEAACPLLVPCPSPCAPQRHRGCLSAGTFSTHSFCGVGSAPRDGPSVGQAGVPFLPAGPGFLSGTGVFSSGGSVCYNLRKRSLPPSYTNFVCTLHIHQVLSNLHHKFFSVTHHLSISQ